MSEHYQIVSDARGEPLPAGSVGVRVRFQLSGCPSSQWSHVLRVRLADELVGHAAVGHMRLNDIVQGDQIVLEGVEASEAPTLASSLRRAVDAANQADTCWPDSSANVAQDEANAIARQISREALMTDQKRDARTAAELEHGRLQTILDSEQRLRAQLGKDLAAAQRRLEAAEQARNTAIATLEQAAPRSATPGDTPQRQAPR